MLTCNVVEFNKELFLQRWGTSMGAACSQAYADIFMANFEKEFLASIPARLKNLIFAGYIKHLLDNIFLLWQGTDDDFA